MLAWFSPVNNSVDHVMKGIVDGNIVGYLYERGQRDRESIACDRTGGVLHCGSQRSS